MTKVKRVLAMLLVMLTLMSCNITGFAATKPTMKCMSHPTAIARGKTGKYVFKINVGSFTKKKFCRTGWQLCWGKWSSAQAKTSIQKIQKKYINGIDSSTKFVLKLKIDKSMAKGKYIFVYAPFYRSKNSTSAWRINKDNIKTFAVTVK